MGAYRRNRRGPDIDEIALGCRRLHEPAGVYSHTSAPVSSEMKLLTRLPHTEAQTVYSRLTSRRILSLSTSACWYNTITTESSPRRLRLTYGPVRPH